MKIQKQSQKAITLIALVITIVILLILAGIVISRIIGENGLFATSKKAKYRFQEASARETVKTKIMEFQINWNFSNNENANLENLRESNYFRNDNEIEKIEYYSKKTAKINWNDYEKNGERQLIYAKISLKNYSFVYTINQKLEIVEIDDIPIEEFDLLKENKENDNISTIEYLYEDLLPDNLQTLVNNNTLFKNIIESKNNIDYIISNPATFKEIIISNKNAIEILCDSEYAVQEIINNDIWLESLSNCDNKDIFEAKMKEKLIKTATMTSNTEPIYEAVGTSEYKGKYKSYFAFDKDMTSFWYSNSFTNGNGGQAIGYDFGEANYIYKFVLVPRNNGSDTKSVSEYKLQGSNDGSIWEDIETYTNSDSSDKIKIEKTVKCSKAYSQYRIEYISTFNGSGTTYASVWELEFYCYKNNIINDELKNNNKTKFADYGEVIAELYANSTCANAVIDNEAKEELTDLLKKEELYKIVISSEKNVKYIADNPNLFKDAILSNSTRLTQLLTSGYLKYILDNSEWKESLENYFINTPEITSNTSDNGNALASSSYSSNYEYKAFDKDESTYWESKYNNGEDYIQFEFNEQNIIYEFSIYPKIYDEYLRVKDIVLYGSNDGENFKTLTDVLTCTEEKVQSFSVNPNDKYKYYRIVIKNMWGGSSINDIMIKEINFKCIKF